MSGPAKRLVVTVAADGTVSAVTEGITGSKCLNYIAVLEDLLAAQTVHSEYTSDFHRVTGAVTNRQEQHDGR
ncbi:DUF2997 domain-containing protein [Dactylosporangium sp. NPDC051485]|uniref:DUF2997 domain-containing protein n=1 Tax=Dactylosporangium sp. NPDC051485 TaxID=3154846 RepID=UPI00343979F7